MKVFLILLACIQDPSLSLQDTCIQQPLTKSYDTIDSCLYDLNIKAKEIQKIPDVYVSGFCTTKYIF